MLVNDSFDKPLRPEYLYSGISLGKARIASDEANTIVDRRREAWSGPISVP